MRCAPLKSALFFSKARRHQLHFNSVFYQRYPATSAAWSPRWVAYLQGMSFVTLPSHQVVVVPHELRPLQPLFQPIALPSVWRYCYLRQLASTQAENLSRTIVRVLYTVSLVYFRYHHTFSRTDAVDNSNCKFRSLPLQQNLWGNSFKLQ